MTARPLFVGRAWMDGDPFLVVDRAHAESWNPCEDEYLRLVVEIPAEQTEIDVGEGRGVLLGSDYDDGTVEVFRTRDDELLFLGVRYADALDYETFVADGAALALEPAGALEVTSGELAVLGSARHWDGSPIVREREAPYPDDWGSPNGDSLIVRLPPGRYTLLTAEVDRDTYGLAVWRLVPVSR